MSIFLDDFIIIISSIIFGFVSIDARSTCNCNKSTSGKGEKSFSISKGEIMRNENFDKTSVTICRFRIFIKIRNKSQLAGGIVKSWEAGTKEGEEWGKQEEYFANSF